MITAKKGKVRPQVKISTNCIGIDGSFKIGVVAQGACLAAGDTVQLKSVGNPVQTCRILKVEPQPPATGPVPVEKPHHKHRAAPETTRPAPADSPPASPE